MSTTQSTGRWAHTLKWFAALAGSAILAACGGGGSGGGSASTDGSLRVALTDAPTCGYDHVWVTIEKVRVNQSSSASDTDGGWTDLTLSPARRVDLLDLTNGVLEELGTMPLQAGHYSQIRLVLASNSGTGTSTIANAVQPTGGAVTALSTPSAQQSGLKLQAHFDVAAGQMADVVLDFDACKSVVKAGNSGNYNLKPVISVLQRAVTGITGFVSTTLATGSTTVAVQQDGATVRATAPMSSGQFSIPYLNTGTYTLVVTSQGRATAVVTGVPVSSTSTTTINGTATAIAPPASTMADVTGAVTSTSVSGSTTVSAVVTDASMRALQSLTGGPVIEVASKPADAVLGTYSFHLPQAAPQKAAYSTTGTLTFTADSAVAGKYTIEAQAPGRATTTKPADITGGSTVVNFNWGP